MWKFNKVIYLFAFLFVSTGISVAQNCDYTLSGKTLDLGDGTPISYANIYIKEMGIGDITDSLGNFKIEHICSGAYHLTISHIGCETQELFIQITNDTSLAIQLDHNSQLLQEVLIVAKTDEESTQPTQTLNSETIGQKTDEDLATMIENISGVSTIKNGSGISKPVVHGLYGNRISIINNGVTQSGQQWGVDHSPEIDPLVAKKITVVKGVGVLEYQSSSLGSVILVEPKEIDNEPHLHGEGRYFYETNGRGNGVNLDIQKYGKHIAWRAVGTLKKNGDRHTSNYFLRNSGSESVNVAIQLEKDWNKKWFSSVFFSSYNTEIGILRGSHIGNITDLKEALERDVPFYTEEEFSYSIDPPFQKVNHHLLKLQSKYLIDNHQSIKMAYAGQYDLRKEFDVRRSGRSDMPALSIEQVSHFFEIKYRNYLSSNWELKSGVQINQIDNANVPETGILPLIPDYISNKYGGYLSASKSYKKTLLELGGRYDFVIQNVATISRSTPREVIRYQNTYHNVSSIIGVTHKLTKAWRLAFNLGYSTRNPEPNELYSNGLHQGVSGIEEGDPNLGVENSTKGTLSINGKVSKKLHIEALGYYQNIDNYIFLNPTDEIRVTIRGAFPVFKYEQTNARLMGLDLSATYELTDRFNVIGKYSFLNGHDRTQNIPLVYMPPNNIYGEINYHLPNLGGFQKISVQVNSRYVFEQKNLLLSQDFVAPPPAYFLLGIKLSTERQFRKFRSTIYARAENVLNATYRDYLNRQRYFADDLGFNLIVGINISF